MTRPLPQILPKLDQDMAWQDIAWDVEMDRVELLIDIAHRHRRHKTTNAAQQKQLVSHQNGVRLARQNIGYHKLRPKDKSDLANHALALDLMMLVAFEYRRASAWHMLNRLRATQSEQGGVSLAMASEVLMADANTELRLSQISQSNSEYVQAGIFQIEGEGARREIRAGFALKRLMLTSEIHADPPQGVHLAYAPGMDIPPFVVGHSIQRRIEEIQAMISQPRDYVERSGLSQLFLFTGGPGTGKSLAVRHMAQALNKIVFQIDIGRAVSKWIGETESHLTSIFESLNGSDAILLFEEADAMLGKRVEIKEGRDQNSNMTISHMLNLFDRFRFPVILTSNLQDNLDPAFLRRAGIVLRFRRPNLKDRARLWRNLLEHHIGEIVMENADEWAKLVAPVDLSAAEISAAISMLPALSQAANTQIDKRTIARAIWLVRVKTNMTYSKANLGELGEFLDLEVAL